MKKGESFKFIVERSEKQSKLRVSWGNDELWYAQVIKKRRKCPCKWSDLTINQHRQLRRLCSHRTFQLHNSIVYLGRGLSNLRWQRITLPSSEGTIESRSSGVAQAKYTAQWESCCKSNGTHIVDVINTKSIYRAQEIFGLGQKMAAFPR